ncbi:Phospholipase B1, membrane-associated [Liparis tanakae]|uniref:Phospholipase B1, membrane-associated n=1 Tax=Liparis tanakae TaxID=230148 RepID=A0A4Z2FRU7_9TELE|nr:Phospholipase B1, membrane-associated [Liparis tanakae]
MTGSALLLLAALAGACSHFTDAVDIDVGTDELSREKDSLSRVMDNTEGLGERPDFTAVLQSEPVILQPSSYPQSTWSDLNQVAVQIWTSMAANGAGAKTDNLLLLLTQYRGLSWSIGGDENITTVTTLPNILREFNPSLTGFSEGTGGQDAPQAFLNQAVAGATSSDLVHQVHVLVGKMKNDSRIDFHNDWKVITVFIGGNDLCDFCTDSVPRAVVNLIEVLDIVPLRDLHSDKTLGCPTWFTRLVCPCILKPTRGSSELQKVKDLNKAYQLEPVGNKTFTQDFSAGIDLKCPSETLDFENDWKLVTLFIGGNDLCQYCNDRLEPVGKKQTYNHFTNSRNNIKCPTEEHPYIFTKANSLPSPSPPAPTTDTVPAWLAAVLAVSGLLIGCAVTWLLLSCRAKRKNQRMPATMEMKGTKF